MTSYRYCPSCKEPNEPTMVRCAKCGSALPSTAVETLPPEGRVVAGHLHLPPIPALCQRCGKGPVGVSPSVRGGGPWFCWPCFRETTATPERPASREAVYGAMGRIAEELARVPAWQLAAKRAPGVRSREPGEDDE